MINSVFTVTNFRTGKMEQVIMEGTGQLTVKALRGLYPRFTKIVLDGFWVNGNYKRLRI